MALMALTPASSIHANANTNPSAPQRLEAKGNKAETFKNVTVQPLGPSYIQDQKRYQEIAIMD
jgi:hypothetical protein